MNIFLSVSAMSLSPSQVYSKSAGVEANLLDSKRKEKKKKKSEIKHHFRKNEEKQA